MNYPPEFYNDIVQETLSSAKIVVPLILDLVHPASVVDVGCATGAWLSVFHGHGVSTIMGLDGSSVDPSTLLIPSECFRVADLAKPFSLSEQFDLAICLEVAEHLPAASADSFVRSLCQLAPVVLFSAAVPGQGGEYHMNEQWPEYWRQVFANQHFDMFDPFRPLLWHDERVAFYYRQNLFLFIRHDVLTTNPRFSQLLVVKDGNGLMLVQDYILFGNVSALPTLKRLPHLLWEALRRRVQRLFLKRTDLRAANPSRKVEPH